MISGIVLTIAAALVAILGLGIIRWLVPLERLQEQHEVASVGFAVVGGLYGIILAFVLVSSWNRFEETRATVEREANAAADLWRHARGFDVAVGVKVRHLVESYLRSVVVDEWPQMRSGEPAKPTQAIYDRLWEMVIQIEPTSDKQVALYQATIGKVDDLAEGRRDRIVQLATRLPEPVWVFLLVFGIATVSCSYFFGMPRVLPQVAMTAVLASVIASSLWLVSEMQTPFSGDISVSPRAYEVVSSLMAPIDAPPQLAPDRAHSE